MKLVFSVSAIGSRPKTAVHGCGLTRVAFVASPRGTTAFLGTGEVPGEVPLEVPRRASEQPQ